MQRKTLIQRIEEALNTFHGMRQGSSITQALAVVIFNVYCASLVGIDDDEKLARAITPEMISDSSALIVSILTPYIKS